ncbi:unnamed protein product [Echinostoma caproni]|uniref:MULE domain-containing protein n=1 Tax=Echinostoma caproni TaxID=27848 RepID=A0A183B8Z4_9TREM|nr:unnamed protein product [Echinostoma caproni]
MLHCVARFNDVLLADATHQLNCGGYALWHAMLADDTGSGRSFFYAISPDESGDSHKSAVGTMKAMCPVFAQCKTMVVDRSLAHYNAFSGYFLSCYVIFCRFHLVKDIKKKCKQLSGMPTFKKQRIFQWMRNMVYFDTEVSFRRFLAAVESRGTEEAVHL